MIKFLVKYQLAIFLICIGMVMTGCGFKLAGKTVLPESLGTIYLVTTNLSEAQRNALLQRLENTGTRIITHAADDAVRLTVSFKIIPDRTVVASASTGKTIRRLARRLDYSLKSADGKELAASRALLQQRNITLDDDNLHSSSRERADVIENLEQALFNQLIHQLKRF